ncbi:MAG: methionyl-tRNA formyltransferase [Geminicoccaceae bacterium]|nr:methionyl-tRNA formyltransferase [Geminicoccaceae bacterium]
MSCSPAGSLAVVFMGTAAFAVPALEALAASRHRVVRVYSQPPRPAGRGLKPALSPVHEAAERLGLAVETPATFRDEAARAAFQELGADLGVVAAYGLLLSKPVLDAPRHGCINIHASLLPRWRGASPIQHAILAGDRTTGISVFQMEPSLDTGPVLAREELPIGPRTTSSALHDDLARLAARIIVRVVDDIERGRARAEPQPEEGVTYAPKLSREDGRLDWTRPAAALERQVRAFTPWPGCWTEFAGERLRVQEVKPVDGLSGEPGQVLDDRLTVAAGAGALRLLSLQRAGGRPMPAAAFLRGHPVAVGSRFG